MKAMIILEKKGEKLVEMVKNILTQQEIEIIEQKNMIIPDSLFEIKSIPEIVVLPWVMSLNRIKDTLLSVVIFFLTTHKKLPEIIIVGPSYYYDGNTSISPDVFMNVSFIPIKTSKNDYEKDFSVYRESLQTILKSYKETRSNSNT